MKILHLLSSRKWTGAAEPVFQLCRELIRRGHEVDLAYSQPLPGKRLSSRNLREGKLNLWVEPSRSLYRPAMKQKAEEMGIPVLEALRLNVAANLRDNWNDYFLLRKIFREGRYDIVHCHLGHALFLALLSRGKSGSGPRLVYTHHPAKPLRSGPLQKALVHSRIDHLIVHSPEAETSCKARLRLPEEKISLLRGGIDLEPYLAPQSGAAYREKLGLAPGCLLVGMVARMQERRDHFTLIRAMAQLGLSKEKVACLLIGDGEHRIPIESLIRDLKLEGQVFAPGYLGEDYLDALAAIECLSTPRRVRTPRAGRSWRRWRWASRSAERGGPRSRSWWRKGKPGIYSSRATQKNWLLASGPSWSTESALGNSATGDASSPGGSCHALIWVRQSRRSTKLSCFGNSARGSEAPRFMAVPGLFRGLFVPQALERPRRLYAHPIQGG
jgi:glycosyltransferase involved in cell wall biosynthesis